MSLLGDAGLLPTIQDEELNGGNTYGRTEMPRQSGEGESRGQPWFEEMIEGSELGRLRKRRGGETSADGKSIVEWEIMEFSTDEGGAVMEGGIATGKRKQRDMSDGEDLIMRENH